MGNLSNINKKHADVYEAASTKGGAKRPIPIDTILPLQITRIEVKDFEKFNLGVELTVIAGPYKGVALWDWFTLGGDASEGALKYGHGRWKGINEAVGNEKPADDTNQLIGKVLQATVYDHEPNWKNPEYTDEKFGNFEPCDAKAPQVGSAPQATQAFADEDIPF